MVNLSTENKHQILMYVQQEIDIEKNKNYI